ncbi:MAG TPA: hypothetical protein VIJ39_10310 [Solirubrobacteraceae bacterium]
MSGGHTDRAGGTSRDPRSKPHKGYRRHSALTVVLALICQGFVACGGAGSGTSSSTVHHGVGVASRQLVVGDYDDDDFYPGRYDDADKDDDPRPRDRDGDTDNKSGSYYDGDDDAIRDFGHAASTNDRRAVESLVTRYFTAAAAEDGSAACPLITSPLARSVPAILGHHPPGPAYASGSTCAEVMSKVFKQNHRQLAAEASILKVTGVRLRRNHGWAVLGFETLPGRDFRIAREVGVWKVQVLLDEELP